MCGGGGGGGGINVNRPSFRPPQVLSPERLPGNDNVRRNDPEVVRDVERPRNARPQVPLHTQDSFDGGPKRMKKKKKVKKSPVEEMINRAKPVIEKGVEKAKEVVSNLIGRVKPEQPATTPPPAVEQPAAPPRPVQVPL